MMKNIRSEVYYLIKKFCCCSITLLMISHVFWQFSINWVALFSELDTLKFIYLVSLNILHIFIYLCSSVKQKHVWKI